jgi:uncharacterized protein YlxW (UPF0749 family)
MRSFFMAVVAILFMAHFASPQTPPAADRSQEQLVALLKEVRAQQADLAANQAKIDEKLAAVAEAVRQARIYSSRAGR